MAETLRVSGKHFAQSSHRYGAGNDQGECVQVLVVDDYEPFRRFVCSMLMGIRNCRLSAKPRTEWTR